MEHDNEARTALITGGTRRIGRAIARQLAAAGYRIVMVYRENDVKAAEALAELRPTSAQASVLRADVSTAEGAARAVREAQRVLDGITLLVNGVGPFVPAPFEDTTVEDYGMMVAGNLHSVFYMCQAVLPLMRAQGGGTIINMGSLNAEMARGAPNAAVYHALKVAVVSLTKSIARSEGKHGIRANVVNPGIVHTTGISEEIAESVPLGRLGTPEEVAEAVAWLASDAARYVSGAVINVNGGLYV